MWLYKDKVIESLEDFPQNTFGFIYEVTHLPSGKKYLGKKVLFFNQKKALTKRELAEYRGPGRKPKYKRVEKESDWKTYYGSQENIKQLVKEGKAEDFKREILYLASNKKMLTYIETKLLFLNEVLEKDEYLNSNILGSFYRKDFE
jgi:hypothetical protein